MTNGIIFDLDGVLVDAADWHYQALNEALAVFGYAPIGREDHLARFNGLPTRDKMKLLGITQPLAGIIDRVKQVYTRRLIRIQARPDYAKLMLLYELRKHYALAVASNARTASVIEMLDATGIDVRLFEVIMGGDQVQRAKPAPEIYQSVCRELGADPDECVVVEDSEPGLQAAQAAGCRVIQVQSFAEVNAQLFKREKLL